MPTTTRPTSFWRGESGPLFGFRDAPILIAISSQGFLMRSRMRVFFSGGRCMLSLEICSVSALLLLWFRQPVAAMAWRLQLRLEPMMIACDGLAATCAPRKNLPKAAPRVVLVRFDASPEAFVLLRYKKQSRSGAGGFLVS